MSKGTALITGGAKRIGKAIALHLAESGYDIALHYNHSDEDAHVTAGQIEETGVQCHLFCCDFAEMNQVHGLIAEVFRCCPDCNVLINNASIFERCCLLKTDEELFDRHFQINFKTPFFLTRDFARLAGQGNIINIIDTKAYRTVTKFFAYTLTKKMLLEFTRMAAKELAPRFRVNGVAPGVILPPQGDNEEYLKKRASELPLKDHGDTGSVVSAISFLLQNPFITGHCIVVDGGEHLK